MFDFAHIAPAAQTVVVIGVVIYVLLVASTLFTIIYDKRDPVKTLSWVMVIVLVPVVGFVIYVVFGQNYRKRKIFDKKGILDSLQIGNIVSKQLYSVNSMFADHKPEIAQNRDIITLLLNSNKSPLTYDNRVEVLNNGDQTFAALSKALVEARSFIHMEYYIVSDDDIGNFIADILIEKARAGVEVRVIYDDVGSWTLPKSYVRRLTAAGVQVKPFMPVAFPMFTSKINYRNHRKIVVVDGKIAFTGGLNIADRYILGERKLGAWRDTHIRIEGEAVLSLQTVFITDWYFVSGVRLNKPEYFPKQSKRGNVAVQIASSGPDSDWATIMQAYFAAITRAQDHIYITTPYFLPNAPILTAIKVASLSGVDVRLLIPSKSDGKIVFWATRSYISELLEAGVKIYLYRGGFVHAKVLSIDGMFSAVGSANMDERSFEDNFEVTAFLYDREKTARLEHDFLEDLQLSRRIMPERWQYRPKKECVYEAVARLLSPLL